MLYLGHFVFETYDGEKRIGYFNLLVDAKDVESAQDNFRARLSFFRKNSDLFSGRIRFFLDGIVELSELPEEALLTNYRTFHGDPPPSIYNILPPQKTPGCGIYPVIPDNNETTCPKVEPFLSFE
jgi:hypothetical protein